MANLMQTSAAWLGARLKESAGQVVTYARKLDTVSITAVPVVREYETFDSSGFAVQVVSVDWSIVAADLVLNEAAIEPRRGDLITNENGEKFEVMQLGQGPCFRAQDSSQILLRCHTKRILNA